MRRWVEEIFNAKRLDACDELIAPEYIEHAVTTFGDSSPGRNYGPEVSTTIEKCGVLGAAASGMVRLKGIPASADRLPKAGSATQILS